MPGLRHRSAARCRVPARGAGRGMTAAAAVAEPASGLMPDDVLAVRALTVVSEGDEFIVGDPQTATYVVLPQVGVQVIELLREGRTIASAAAEASHAAGEDVDVAGFAASLIELGFAERAGTEPAGAAATAPHAPAEPGEPAKPADARAAAGVGVPAWVHAFLAPAAWALYAAAGLGVVVLFALHPGLFPCASDIFFLDTPARSLAALTLITYALAFAHEG